MNIIVTGSAGLLGSNFCKYIVGEGKVNILAIDNLSGGYLEFVPTHEYITFMKADLTNIKDQTLINDYIKTKFNNKIDYIWHFAAYAAEGLSPFIRQFNYSNNLISTAFLINCAITHDTKRFIFTSSMAVYGDNKDLLHEDLVPKPIDPYGIAKYACEMDLQVAFKQHGLEYCIIRPHNVYGINQNIWDPYRNVIGIWMLQVLENKPTTIYGDGLQERSFSYIDDIVTCLYKCAFQDNCKNEIINLGGTKPSTIKETNDLLKEIVECDGYKSSTIYLEKRYEAKIAVPSYTKSQKLLDYKDIHNLRDGIQKMWDWAKSLKKDAHSRKYFDSYELNKNIYSYWKIN